MNYGHPCPYCNDDPDTPKKLEAAEWLANEIEGWGESGLTFKLYVWGEFMRFLRAMGRNEK